MDVFVGFLMVVGLLGGCFRWVFQAACFFGGDGFMVAFEWSYRVCFVGCVVERFLWWLFDGFCLQWCMLECKHLRVNDHSWLFRMVLIVVVWLR